MPTNSTDQSGDTSKPTVQEITRAQELIRELAELDAEMARDASASKTKALLTRQGVIEQELQEFKDAFGDPSDWTLEEE